MLEMCTQHLEKIIMGKGKRLTEKGERANETDRIAEEGSDQQPCHVTKG
jgi:hypothetical protein